MRARVRDPDALEALKPMDVAAYLRASGWRKEADLHGKASLWTREGTSASETDLILPHRTDFGDYALRMGELLGALSAAENRSELEVLRDVFTTRADLIRVKAPSRPSNDGTLPLNDAVTFVERSRELMLSAACAAIEKRAFYAKRKPQQAMDYLSDVRMGQTEQGSYVLTMLSPVVPELKSQQHELPPSEPFQRVVIRTLVSALASLESAAQTAAMNGDMAPFTNAVRDGVSANLCDAVVGLARAAGGDALDVLVTWSPTRPVEGKSIERAHVGADTVPIIEEASRHFRDTAPVDDFELEGFVTRLDRGPDASEGDVTVEGVVEDRMRRVVVRLPAIDYSRAVRAHNERLKVKCQGELIRAGRGHRLENPRHFDMILEDENE